MSLYNKEIKVEDLIRFADEESIWLPEFQRPFVWDWNQIRLLVDSLFNDYTISSVLLWEGGDELARRRVGGSIKEIKIPQKGSLEKVTYLLDGQQRTTSMLLTFTNKLVFKGNNVKKTEKIDLFWDSEYSGSDPEKRWVFSDDLIEVGTDKVYLSDLSEKETIQKFRSRFVKLKHAYNFDDTKAEDLFNNDYKEIHLYSKKLTELKDKILKRKIYDIEQKGALEQVLEVFERINTKNTKLSMFDIMVAKTYRQYDRGIFDLRSFFKLISYAGDVKENYFDNIEEIDLDKVEHSLDESDLLFLTMIILDKKFKATEILKLNTDQLSSNTKLLHDKYQYIVGLMNQQFLVEKGELWKFQPIMKFMAACLSERKKLLLEENEFLKTWFWNTLLKNRYPGAQNERIAKDYNIFSEPISFNEKLVRMKKDNTRNFDFVAGQKNDIPDVFDSYYTAKAQQLYRAMILLLKSKGAKDFYNGLIPVKSGAHAHTLEEHHIFPKNSKIGKQITSSYASTVLNDIINNIANIGLLTSETNNSIKSKNPSVYILAFENDYKNAGKHAEFLEIMQSQFISQEMIEMLKKDDFDLFIRARTKALYHQIEKLCFISEPQPAKHLH